MPNLFFKLITEYFLYSGWNKAIKNRLKFYSKNICNCKKYRNKTSNWNSEENNYWICRKVVPEQIIIAQQIKNNAYE